MFSLIAKYISAIVVWTIIMRLIGVPLSAPLSIIILVLCVGVVFLGSYGLRAKSEWSLNPETGEYHRVTFTDKEGRLIDTRTYHKRLTERLLAISQARTYRNWLIPSVVVFGISLFAIRSFYEIDRAAGDNPQHPGVVLLTAIVVFLSGFASVVCAISWLVMFISLRSKNMEAGPLPEIPQNLETLNVNDPSDARQPSLDEIERRLHARARGGDDEPSFPA